jgi:hypothetical protein
MCGIAGEIVLDRSGAPDRSAVERMTDTMQCRGPDGAGSWASGWVALGHRRLSITDLSPAAAQPMMDARSGVAVVFNGCIYNYRELRTELSDGYAFASTSDTEVIIAAYHRWGEGFVEHLVGMFAIVLVDQRHRKVLLARDRLGIKRSTSRSPADGTASRPPCPRCSPQAASTPASTPSGCTTTTSPGTRSWRGTDAAARRAQARAGNRPGPRTGPAAA